MANAATIGGRQKQQRRRLPARRLFSVDEYYRMAEAGILGPDERVELVEGEIIQMAPIGDAHGACVIGLTDWFGAHTQGRALLGVQTALRLTPNLEPEPDIMLLRRREDRYWHGHPTAADVLLIIEVSDSSLRY